ncbi:unnamed protein product [Caenorhabditis angaria]|uniref:Delta-like protein n=1 Tax=Caenorhabditis angaria TaxID=860376 RepID=A0A9P1N844_9PELO|nr:unnamed protein product [Caenorhabditis angaria]
MHVSKFLLVLLPVLANCTGFIRLNFTSSRRINIKIEIIDESQKSFELPLYPNSTRSAVFDLPEYKGYVDYKITMISMFTGTVTGSMVHRRIHLDQKYSNDAFSSDGILLSIQTTYECAGNFYGPRCEQQCDNKLANLARKRCDKMGKIRCDYGWMGPKCSQAVDPRKCSCENSGICVTTSFSNTTLECECQNGFAGDKCEISLGRNEKAVPSESCSNKDVCLNGGTCFANGPKHFCACAHGFDGEFCEISLRGDQRSISEIEKKEGYNYFVITCTIFSLFILLCIACCFTYRNRGSRSDALQRGQTFDFPQMAKVDVVMVKSDEKQIYTIENDYTTAPIKSTDPVYSTIHRPPPPPSQFPPPTPIWP